MGDGQVNYSKVNGVKRSLNRILYNFFFVCVILICHSSAQILERCHRSEGFSFFTYLYIVTSRLPVVWPTVVMITRLSTEAR